ncbi:MAG: recombinase family protein, partial [Clostridia bacterium]|nr:recombinase family protein [Clostridia bacterium]
CGEYAERNDILIVDTYVDRAMTGTNDNRPGFRRMIKDSEQKSWNFVLVYKLDRFSRNKYEMAIHKKTLRDNGVKVISATEFIPDTPEGIILESMLEGYAEYYSAELSQKIRRGNRESRLKGNLTGGTIPYGYYRENKKAVVDEDKANVVRYIYTRYANHATCDTIIKELTAKGILYKGKPFVHNTVYKILKNERYAGIYRLGDEVFDNIYPPIIGRDTYERVRRRLERNRYGKSSPGADYLLRGKVKCGYCGHNLVGESGTSKDGTRRYYYKCHGRKAHLCDCELKPINKNVLDKLVVDTLVNELTKPQIVEKIVKAITEYEKEQLENNAALKLLTNDKAEVDKAVENVLKAIQMGIISQKTVARLKELEARQSELEQQIEIEKQRTEVPTTAEEIRAFYKRAIEMDPIMLIEFFVEEITMYDDKLTIRLTKPNKSPDNNGRGFSLYSKSYKPDGNDKAMIRLSIKFRIEIVV